MLVLCLQSALQVCLHVIHVCVAPHLYYMLNAKDANMEKVLLSCDATTEVQVK